MAPTGWTYRAEGNAFQQSNTIQERGPSLHPDSWEKVSPASYKQASNKAPLRVVPQRGCFLRRWFFSFLQRRREQPLPRLPRKVSLSGPYTSLYWFGSFLNFPVSTNGFTCLLLKLRRSLCPRRSMNEGDSRQVLHQKGIRW